MSRFPSTSVFVLAFALLSPPLAGADLCQGLVQDRQPHPMTPLAKPAAGETTQDPQFGTTIRRITAVPQVGPDPAIRPLYATVSAWNADESLLLLYNVGNGYELYDGRDYRFLMPIDIEPSDIEHVYWHTSDPDVLLYPSGRFLMRFHVQKALLEPIREFEFCTGSVTAGPDPMFMSWDSNVIGLQCDEQVFIYRVSDNTVTGRAPTSLTAPQVAPSGTRAVTSGYVVDLGLHVQRRLDLGNALDHASLGRLGNGNDTYNTVAYDPGPAGSDVGSLVTFDMTDGSSRVIVGPATGYPYPPSGTHVSALAYRAPGWTILSIVGDPSGQGVLDNEIVLADTNTGQVCRLAHHRSFGSGNTRLARPYWAEPHAVPSPRGTRVVFASDWGNGHTVDTYVLELPSFGSLGLSVATSQSGYRTGDRFLASMGLSNPGLDSTVDLYLLELLPDGDQVVMFTAGGVGMGRVSEPAGLRPLVPALELSAPFVWEQGDLLDYVWNGSEWPGNYALVLAAVRPGSLADDRFDEGDVVAAAVAWFAFSP
jgi:hypothetical protein